MFGVVIRDPQSTVILLNCWGFRYRVIQLRQSKADPESLANNYHTSRETPATGRVFSLTIVGIKFNYGCSRLVYFFSNNKHVAKIGVYSSTTSWPSHLKQRRVHVVDHGEVISGSFGISLLFLFFSVLYVQSIDDVKM